MQETKDVALVLSSGGPRGFAYIGAIEELERRGYRITSVAGTSIGSLVGGLYAAGKLQEFRDWLFQLDNFKVMALLDVSFSSRYLVKGEKLIATLREIVPSADIGDFAIPFTAVASDLYTGEEVLFSEGDLFTAIRSSISIPSLLRPVKYGHRTLVDGGLVNTFPLDRVARNGHDILVGFDVNDIDASSINSFLEGQDNQPEETVEDVKALLVRLRKKKPQAPFAEGDDNYLTIISRSFSIANHALAKKAVEAVRPDVLVEMTLDSYSSISDYAKGPEIAERGRALMSAALDKWEALR
jgi:Predicted esterase of the alpha-beta hydrolase superfamily